MLEELSSELLLHVLTFVDSRQLVRLHSLNHFFDYFCRKNAAALRHSEDHLPWVKIDFRPRELSIGIAESDHISFGAIQHFQDVKGCTGLTRRFSLGPSQYSFTKYKGPNFKGWVVIFRVVSSPRLFMDAIQLLIEHITLRFRPTAWHSKLSMQQRVHFANRLPKIANSIQQLRFHCEDTYFKLTQSRLILDVLSTFPQALQCVFELNDNINLPAQFFNDFRVRRLKVFYILPMPHSLEGAAMIDEDTLLNWNWTSLRLGGSMPNLSENGLSSLINQWATGKRDLHAFQIQLTQPLVLEIVLEGLLVDAVFENNSARVVRPDGEALYFRHKRHFHHSTFTIAKHHSVIGVY